MDNYKFKVGDPVSLKYFDFTGIVVGINEAPPEVMKFFNNNEATVVYRVEIEPGSFITTTEDGIELIKPERVSE